MSKLLSSNKIIAVVGPTASGKTSYSIELAKRIDGEIISADSRLFYKGFNIGTAKPTIQERAGIPHYMIDIVEPEFEYTAGLYKDEAIKIIEKILLKGKTPIVVGGTGLYIDILLKNYNLPKIEPNIELRQDLSKYDREILFNMLIDLDNNAQNYINIYDKRKIIRAIEIIKATKKSLNDSRSIETPQYNVEWIGKNYDRKTLYERIDKRVDIMFENGLVDETKYLLNKHGRIKNLIGTIGYKEVIGYLDGEYDISTASELLKQNTRRYAKRQLTWFRKNESIVWDIYPEKLKK